jgi:hypothetical protein
MGRVATVRQERRRATWLRRRVRPSGTIAFVAGTAAVVVIVAASLDVLVARRGIHGGTVVPTPIPASPTLPAATYPPGFYLPPEQRQSLTVDGVPLSFSVPTEGWAPGIQRKEFDGTFSPRSLYIAKSTAGGQRAEAVVFWTAYPGSVNTGPCHILLSQPIPSSAAGLAAVMAKAPGIELVRGPSTVTLGGREAIHLVLTVREDLGCDPGYFFTWPDECWGDCWIRTDPRDMIGVWVVEVEGTRLVIEAETTRQGVWAGPSYFIEEKTELSDAELWQEVRQIVESIRFE